jgi:hypothetical protein
LGAVWLQVVTILVSKCPINQCILVYSYEVQGPTYAYQASSTGCAT